MRVLWRLRLYEMQDLWAEYDGTDETSFTRAYRFSAAHRLHAPLLSVADNCSLYGKCNNPNDHGHNYQVEVTVRGPAAAASAGTHDGADRRFH